ncbi:ATP-binding protein [Pseudoalteromonas fenneropenaei]|uniref:histidine kinase n=1 Tax=Pseudoalteromonas fenneropenaei TaxID=1737459 RepID=A0ABV7CID2_9GAMM
MTSKLKLQLSKLVLIVAVVVLLVSIWGSIVYFEDKVHGEVEQQIVSELRQDAEDMERHFDAYFQEKIGFISFLKETPPMLGIARSLQNNGKDPRDGAPIEVWKERIATIFGSLQYTYDDILQLRIILTDGQEFVRVDRKAGKVARLSDQKLQNKAHRDYVSETLKLNEGEFFTSNISLNVEHGRVEIPLNPVVRFASPLYDTENNLYAILVLNASAKSLLAGMASDKIEHILVDEQGRYIWSADNSKQFGADYGIEDNFTRDYEVKSSDLTGIWQIKETNSELVSLGVRKVINQDFATGGRKMELFTNVPATRYDNLLNERRRSSYFLLGTVSLVFLVFMIGMIVFFKNREKYQGDKAVFESIINGSDDPIISFDKELNVTTFNSASLLLFPDLKRMLLGGHASAVGKLPFNELAGASEKLKREGDALPIGAREFNAGGVARFISFKVGCIAGVSGKIIGYTLFGNDITQEKLVEQDIKRINESLEKQVADRTRELQKEKEKAEKASAVKSAFISTISHEMRTPLNGILGTLNLIRREPLSDKQLTYLEMTETSSSTLASLINDILDLSKIEAGKLEVEHEPFNPLSVIEHVVTSISIRAFEKQLALTMDVVDVEYVELVGDAGRIKQIVYNLLSNAIKFTSSGSVSVRGWTEEHRDKVLFHVEVTDTGIGIDPSNHHKIFQAFSQESATTGTEFGGTGLGLSICRQLCELMGGSIDFTSNKGQGSSFSFSLPFTIATAVARSKERVLAGKRFKLLLAGDMNETVLTRIVNKFGGAVVDGQADYIVIDSQSSALTALLGSEDYQRTVVLYNSCDDVNLPAGFLAKVAKPVRLAGILDLFDRGKLLKSERQLLSRLQQNQSSYDLSGNLVVVVDDNSINLEVAKGILQSANISVITCSSGHHALKVLADLEKQQVSVCCVLMDCNMPVMDGYQCTRMIREGKGGEINKKVPVVAMTASAMSGERERCLGAGMDDYVTKPVDSTKLFGVLQRYATVTRSAKGIKAGKAAPVVADANSQESAEPVVALVPSDPVLMKAVNSVKNTKEQADSTKINFDVRNLPQSEVLDAPTAVNRLLGDVDLYTKICVLFTDQAEARILSLKEKAKARDDKAVRQISHALRGQSGDIGAGAFHKLMADIEQHAIDEQADEYNKLVNKVDAEYGKLKKVLGLE